MTRAPATAATVRPMLPAHASDVLALLHWMDAAPEREVFAPDARDVPELFQECEGCRCFITEGADGVSAYAALSPFRDGLVLEGPLGEDLAALRALITRALASADGLPVYAFCARDNLSVRQALDAAGLTPMHSTATTKPTRGSIGGEEVHEMCAHRCGGGVQLMPCSKNNPAVRGVSGQPATRRSIWAGSCRLGAGYFSVNYQECDAPLPFISLFKLVDAGFSLIAEQGVYALSEDGSTWPLERVGELMCLVPTDISAERSAAKAPATAPPKPNAGGTCRLYGDPLVRGRLF